MSKSPLTVSKHLKEIWRIIIKLNSLKRLDWKWKFWQSWKFNKRQAKSKKNTIKVEQIEKYFFIYNNSWILDFILLKNAFSIHGYLVIFLNEMLFYKEVSNIYYLLMLKLLQVLSEFNQPATHLNPHHHRHATTIPLSMIQKTPTRFQKQSATAINWSTAERTVVSGMSTND